jgi:hypothetical protein
LRFCPFFPLQQIESLHMQRRTKAFLGIKSSLNGIARRGVAKTSESLDFLRKHRGEERGHLEINYLHASKHRPAGNINRDPFIAGRVSV